MKSWLFSGVMKFYRRVFARDFMEATSRLILRSLTEDVVLAIEEVVQTLPSYKRKKLLSLCEAQKLRIQKQRDNYDLGADPL